MLYEKARILNIHIHQLFSTLKNKKRIDENL